MDIVLLCPNPHVWLSQIQHRLKVYRRQECITEDKNEHRRALCYRNDPRRACAEGDVLCVSSARFYSLNKVRRGLP